MVKQTRKLVGYNVYHAPEGSAESFYGFVDTLDEARELAAKGRALEASLYDTARAAGHCAGLSAPDKDGEDSDVTEWFGDDDCAVAVYKMVPDVSRVRYWWDDRQGVEAGWYCETYDADGDLRDDSQKVWFPVSVDEFAHNQADELEAALKEAFPGAELEAA